MLIVAKWVVYNPLQYLLVRMYLYSPDAIHAARVGMYRGDDTSS